MDQIVYEKLVGEIEKTFAKIEDYMVSEIISKNFTFEPDVLTKLEELADQFNVDIGEVKSAYIFNIYR